uniref:NADH-ubiquinone oxidoreductase chain 5 n=1 Tax=Ampulex compressa TaxID=860918 RepID=A0A343DRL2_AMPCP|nr:NADH dehydrogenase subunit 5 [Ampulex compressa]
MMTSSLMMYSSMYLYSNNMQIMIEWSIFKMNSLNFEFIILLDWISMLFSSIVLLISSMIMIYSSIYMNSSNYNFKFIMLLITFILSMILMINSPNIMSIILGWDGLGLSSFCLIIFYQNWQSYNSGMITIITNRIGDVAIIISMSLSLSYGSGNTFLSNFMNNHMILFIMLAAMTKSAQFPFSSWLPAAMAAPTPVSALVHSSTLVTAGIYLMIRYNMYIYTNNLSTKMLLLLASLTMLMSSMSAIFEFDMKKIIALSTLSQLGLMMSMLMLNLKYLALYHLLTHALFKSLLFMCSGIIIHNSFNNQDIRLLSMMNYSNPFISSALMISFMSLSGFPFMSGYYSKDLIMETMLMSSTNKISLMMLFMASIFTVMYSIRVCYYCINSKIYNSYIPPITNMSENLIMNLSIMPLTLLSIISGSMMNWMFFSNYTPSIILPINLKTLMIFISLSGIILFMYMKMMKLMKMKFLTHMFKSLWFLNNFNKNLHPYTLHYSEKFYENLEKGWLEHLISKNLLNLIKMLKSYYINKINTMNMLKFSMILIIMFIMPFLFMMIFYL